MDTRYAPDTEPTQTFSWQQSDAPSRALLRAIAEVGDADPATIEPLFNVIDPDALDNLFASTGNPHQRVSGRVQFQYQGYQIEITASGRGYIYQRDE